MAAPHDQPVTRHDAIAARRARPPGSLGLIIAGLAAWILVVVVASGDPGDDSFLGVEHLDVVWMIVFAFAMVIALAVLVWLRPSGAEVTRAAGRRRRGTGFLVLAALAFMVWRPDLFEALTGAVADQLAEVDSSGATAAGQTVTEPPIDTVAQATDVLVLVAMGGLCAGLWWFLFRRDRSSADEQNPATAEPVCREPLALALDRLHRELVTTADPRQAVLHAYAILESGLAEVGRPRGPSETPVEHLRGALGDLAIDPAPFVALGRLYEVARFSDRQITAAQRRQAAMALDAARGSLAPLA